MERPAPAHDALQPAQPPPLHAAPRSPWAVRGLFVIALVYAVREAQPLLAPILVAVALTFVLAPLVRRLRRHHVPEVIGAAIVVGALLASTVPLAMSLARPAAQWWERAPTTVAQLLAQFDRVRAAIPGLGPPPPAPQLPVARGSGRATQPAATPAAPAPPDLVKERLASEGVALTGLLLGRSASFAFTAASTLILLYFFLASEHWMLSRCVEAIPRRRTRALVLGGVRAAQREIGRYLLAVGLINAGAGVVTGLAVWALKLPNPTLWGTVVAVLCFVPYLGPLAIAALLLLAGMASFSDLSAMLAPALAFGAIHAFESNVFSPWVVGRRLALSPISVFLSVMFWAWLWGIAGALIAVPVLIAVRCVCQRSRGLRLLSRFLEGNRRTPPTLRSLLRRPRPSAQLPPVPVPRRARMAATATPATTASADRAPPSEAVDVAQAGVVDVLAPAAGEQQLVARPLQHHP